MAFISKAHDYSRLDFDVILMTHIQECGRQLTKIDTSLDSGDFSRPQGVSHGDIVQSYSDMVEHLESLLEPELDEEYSNWLNENKWESFGKEDEIFRYAKIKFGKLMLLCHRRQFLFKRVKSAAAAEGEDIESGLSEILAE